MSVEDARLQAARRLRPIVMTALATVAGMVPLAFALGAGSQMLQALAIAVIGSVLVSMILSLIITPAVRFYLSNHRIHRKSALTGVTVRAFSCEGMHKFAHISPIQLGVLT